MSIQKLFINSNWFQLFIIREWDQKDIYSIPNILSTHKNYIEKQIACLSSETEDFEPTLLIATKAAKTNLAARKDMLEARLLVLNENCSEDPNSEIHKAYLPGPSGQPRLYNLIAERDKIKNELEQVNQELIRNKGLHSFLKIIKIDAELLRLSGRHCGDENGLLGKTHQVYKKETGMLETDQKLEEKRKLLSEKKVMLQSFCPGISISDVLKNRPYFIQHFELQRKEVLETIALVQGLAQWYTEVCQNDEREKRHFVAMKIFECYVKRETRLNINHQNLTSLPPEIGQLGYLQQLNVSSNKLRALPPEIGRLGKLILIDVSYNELQALPPEIGQLGHLRVLNVSLNKLQSLPPEIGQLELLQQLDVSSNKLRALPPEIGRLEELQRIEAYSNKLRALPPEIGKLGKLKKLNLSGNGLQALPISLARLPSNCTIAAFNTRLSYEATQAFQAQINHHRALNPALGPIFHYSIYDQAVLADNSSLEEIIGFWITQFRGNFSETNPNCKWFSIEIFDLENFTTNLFYKPLRELDESDANYLKNFLIRLKETKDFKHASSGPLLILNVARMLQGACTNQDFKQKVCFILEDALGTCGDRVANAFNMIYLQWEFLCGSGTLSLYKFAAIILQARRLEIVEKLAIEIINNRNLGDQIETVLYFKVKLKDVLGLPVATEGMLYPGASGVTQKELDEVSKIVLASTSRTQLASILLDSQEWKEKLTENNPELFQAIKEVTLGKQNEVFAQENLNATQKGLEIERVTKEGEEEVNKLLLELTMDWVKKNTL